MFEESQDIVQILLQKDRQFQHLYRKHGTLKKQVETARKGHSLLIEESKLEKMKKEKLLLKDQMARIIANRRKNGGGEGS